MARPRNHAAHVTAAVEGLVNALMTLVEEIARAVPAGVGVHGGGRRAKTARGIEIGNAGPKRRGPGKGNRKLAKAIASSWAKYTPAERAARVAKMHAWRKKTTK
jgi:hypothetical protein